MSRLCHRAGEGLRRRSTGSRTASPAHPLPGLSSPNRWSLQVRFVCTVHPLREALTVAALFQVAVRESLDVVLELVFSDFEAAQLAAEVGVDAEAAAEVHLIPANLLTRGVGDERSLQTDVGNLEPRARVRTAVDVDRHGAVEVRQPPFEFVDECHRAVLGLDDRELAELDP